MAVSIVLSKKWRRSNYLIGRQRESVFKHLQDRVDTSLILFLVGVRSWFFRAEIDGLVGQSRGTGLCIVFL